MLPQRLISPSGLKPQVWWDPALMTSNGPSGGGAWPRKSPSNPGSLPQQTTVWSMRIPQAWKPPALTEVFHGEQGVGEEESSERRGSPGTGALLLAGESGLSHNSALILSK